METVSKTDKHTPGPWRFDKVGYGADLCYHIQTVDMSHRNTFIGEVGGGLQFNSEITANAKLIAAAPELIKALKMADECLRDGIPIEKNDPIHEVFQRLIKQATI